MTTVKSIFSVLMLFTISLYSHAQENKTENIICFTPAKTNKANGLVIGIWNKPGYYSQQFNGLNFELLGQGWLTPFLGLDDGGFIRQTENKHTINGLSLGLTLFNGKVNGLMISPTINTSYSVNGLKIGLVNIDLYDTNGVEVGLENKAENVRGVQIGLVNRTETLRGLQFGLININRSRTTVLVNWRTKKE